MMIENTQVTKEYNHLEEKAFSDKCCDIFNQVFSSNLSQAAFWYKHYENPHRLSTPLLFEKVDNDIAGINGFLAAPFICENEEFYAAQSCDSAVLNEYRGKGIFSSIIKRAQTQLKSGGVDFLFGFPNQYSYPGFMKMGWKHNADFCRYFLPLNWYLLLKNKIGSPFARIIQFLLNDLTLVRLNRHANKPLECVIEVYDRCPFTEEDFITINNCGKIMVKRSIEYYVFKLDNNPTKKFKYITARTDGRLCGFLAYHVLKDEVNIVDWFCAQRGDDKIVLAKLIKQLINIGSKINMPLINIKSKEVKLMKSLGFWNSANIIFRRGVMLLIIYFINSSFETRLIAPEKWQMRGIDIDTIVS